MNNLDRRREGIFAVKDVAMLRNLRREELPIGVMNAELFKHILSVCDAIWRHSGDPSRPHVRLSSGTCSDTYLNMPKVLCNTNLCEIFADIMTAKIEKALYKKSQSPAWIIGADHSGATFSYAVAERLGVRHDFTQKGPNKSQTWQRHVIRPNEMVLFVDEIMTTGSTFYAMREAVIKAHKDPITFAPFVATLVARPDKDGYGMSENLKVISAFNFETKIWPRKDCPLCAHDSPRLDPKAEWDRLTRR